MQQISGTHIVATGDTPPDNPASIEKQIIEEFITPTLNKFRQKT